MAGVGRGVVRVQLDLADRGAGGGDFGERGFFEVRRAGDGRDEIGHQVGPALINVLHLRPLAVDALRQLDQMVIAAARNGDDDQRGDAQHHEHPASNG